MKHQADRAEQLEALGGVIAGKRKEAIDARKESGIEDVWMACEEAYLSIDDANRHNFANARWAKPTSMNGPVESETPTKNDPRSTAFVPLTRRYVDAGSAKLAEILLPSDDKSFSFGPTPIPEMTGMKDDTRPAVGPDGAPVMAPMPAAVAGTLPQAQPGMPQPAAPAPLTIADLAERVIEEAQDKAEKAEKRIYDWMVESGFRRENRKVIHDAARIGVGVLKGPFPEVAKSKAAKKVNGGVEVEIVERVRPATKWIDAWNLFPDGSCGENIHHGDHIFERDYLSERLLEDLKKKKGYLADQIDKVIEEGPEKCHAENANPSEQKAAKKRYAVWYFYGTISRKDMELLNLAAANGLSKDVQKVYAIVTMVNDTVIRATVNPLDSGNFPFRAMPWSRRAGHWAGVGIAEQMSTAQRMVNAATRALLNNAGNSSGPQIIVDREAIEPAASNDWAIKPNKLWFKTAEFQGTDMRAAFVTVDIPNVGNQMMQIIEYGMKMAEESTSIPLVSQGQTGPTTPETLGATQLQNSNANTLLRDIGYTYDDCITEPVVQDYYEWLLMDPSVPEDEKGDFDIDAHGSSALVERAIQDQTLMQMGQMVMNPALGVDPKKWFAEWMKSKRLDPRKMQYTEDEQKKMAETPPPPPVEVQVAQINSASREKVAGLSRGGEGQPDTSMQTAKIAADAKLLEAQAKAQSAEAIQKLRSDTELARAESERQIALDNSAARNQERIDERELLILKYSLENKMTLDQVKVDLAKTQITDQTKRDLAAAEIELAQSEGHQDRSHDMQKHTTSLVRDEVSTPVTP